MTRASLVNKVNGLMPGMKLGRTKSLVMLKMMPPPSRPTTTTTLRRRSTKDVASPALAQWDWAAQRVAQNGTARIAVHFTAKTSPKGTASPKDTTGQKALNRLDS